MTYDDAFMDGYYAAMEDMDDDYSYEGYYDEYDPAYEEYMDGYYAAMETIYGSTKVANGSPEKLQITAAAIKRAHEKSMDIADTYTKVGKKHATAGLAVGLGSGIAANYFYNKAQMAKKNGKGLINFVKNLFSKIKLFLYKIIPNFLKKAVGGDPTKGKRDPLLRKLQNDTKNLEKEYKRNTALANALMTVSVGASAYALSSASAGLMSSIISFQESGELTRLAKAYNNARDSFKEAKKTNPNAEMGRSSYKAATFYNKENGKRYDVDLTGGVYTPD